MDLIVWLNEMRYPELMGLALKPGSARWRSQVKPWYTLYSIIRAVVPTVQPSAALRRRVFVSYAKIRFYLGPSGMVLVDIANETAEYLQILLARGTALSKP